MSTQGNHERANTLASGQHHRPNSADPAKFVDDEDPAPLNPVPAKAVGDKWTLEDYDRMYKFRSGAVQALKEIYTLLWPYSSKPEAVATLPDDLKNALKRMIEAVDSSIDARH